MIDLHLHLLPGIDDGPADLASSVAMARALVEAGVTSAAVSPHIYPALGWDNQRSEILSGIESLAEALEVAGVPLQLMPSAEHFYDEQLEQRIDEGRAVPINLGRYLLVELSTAVLPPDLPAALYRLRRRGVEPLLAHVERYRPLLDQPELLQALVDQDYALQVDAGALAGHYGWSQKRAAWRLVEAGHIAVVASDAHAEGDVRAYLARACQLLEKRLGAAAARRLLIDNPGRIVAGQALDVPT